MHYTDMSREELVSIQKELMHKFNEIKGKNLKLNMSRGKPSPIQLKVSYPLLDTVTSESDLVDENGVDCSNYGCLEGIDGARELLAEMIGTDKEHMLVLGNSSLNIMFDQISRAYTHGYLGHAPWSKSDKVKFLCPVPGYDRHFMITEHFGMEMINIPMTADGPDMDMVEKLVANDPTIKGMWCVPKYSNPTGITYSDETVKRLAALKPAAPDFRLFYDNAYCVHDLYDEGDNLIDIIEECEKNGNEDIVFEFVSTSKISFPGSGIAGMAASKANIADVKSHLHFQTIGHDKINQLRHVKFFKDMDGVKNHMKKHAEFIRPKFEKVLSVFERELGDLGVGTWTKPKGGYFISFDSTLNCATDIYDLCKEGGVTLTSVGATFPYGNDPNDSNLRIAPTYPTVEELEEAAELFTVAVKLASVNKLLKQN